MISLQQEQASIDALRARRAQDKKNPFVINIHDGRLMPNTPRLRVHKDYRVYTGPVKDSTGESRLKWLDGNLMTARPRVVNSLAGTPAPPVFDVGKASQSELIGFALDEYGLVLPEDMPVAEMRNRIMLVATPLADNTDDLA